MIYKRCPRKGKLRHDFASPPCWNHNIIILFQFVPASEVHHKFSLKTGDGSNDVEKLNDETNRSICSRKCSGVESSWPKNSRVFSSIRRRCKAVAPGRRLLSNSLRPSRQSFPFLAMGKVQLTPILRNLGRYYPRMRVLVDAHLEDRKPCLIGVHLSALSSRSLMADNEHRTTIVWPKT
jgi:hypothetical protein